MKPSWRAGLGLDSLMGWAVCRGISRGGCGLRMSLGSLSSDGWGCAACLLSHQLFFSQVYGTDINYCPSLDLSADNLSDSGHMPGIQNKGFRLVLG